MKLKTLLTALSFIFVFSQPVFAVESEEAKIANNLLKLKALNSCEYCNLSAANLTGALYHRDLDEATSLSGANLTNADLTGAKLKDAKIGGAIFCNTKTPWGLDNSGCGK